MQYIPTLSSFQSSGLRSCEPVHLKNSDWLVPQMGWIMWSMVASPVWYLQHQSLVGFAVWPLLSTVQSPLQVCWAIAVLSYSQIVKDESAAGGICGVEVHHSIVVWKHLSSGFLTPFINHFKKGIYASPSQRKNTGTGLHNAAMWCDTAFTHVPYKVYN